MRGRLVPSRSARDCDALIRVLMAGRTNPINVYSQVVFGKMAVRTGSDLRERQGGGTLAADCGDAMSTPSDRLASWGEGKAERSSKRSALLSPQPGHSVWSHSWLQNRAESPSCHRAAGGVRCSLGGPDSPKSRGCFPRRREPPPNASRVSGPSQLAVTNRRPQAI